MDTGLTIDLPGYLLLGLQAAVATGSILAFGLLIGVGVGRHFR